MGRTPYAVKLRDPRWQRRRLEILERDAWMCQLCGDDQSTLVVHHIWYAGEPWDAPEDALVTLCERCHEERPPKPLSPFVYAEQEEMNRYLAAVKYEAEVEVEGFWTLVGMRYAHAAAGIEATIDEVWNGADAAD